ncbi:MAG: transketolase, partial [Betaproteobacteria bacterium]|nr:transketolase [Betaproteobacteria bacterium]
MRNAFADEITQLGMRDERVVLLSGDIGNKLFDRFRDACPRRFYNCGIAEQNMMGVAAGMALSGLRPVVYTIAPFTTTRCYEQIRVDLCYHRAPVLVVGTGSGLSYAELGPTHHSLEDLAIMRVLPEMSVFAPCDEAELRHGMRAALDLPGPSYMRIGKKGEPRVHERLDRLEVGRVIELIRGHDICLIATGTIVPVAQAAADLLTREGLSVSVVSAPCIKPFDEDFLARAFEHHRMVVTVEEHSRIGGLGGLVAEWRARTRSDGASLLNFGADDCFLHEIGSQDHARSLHGLTASNIAARC